MYRALSGGEQHSLDVGDWIFQHWTETFPIILMALVILLFFLVMMSLWILLQPMTDALPLLMRSLYPVCHLLMHHLLVHLSHLSQFSLLHSVKVKWMKWMPTMAVFLKLWGSLVLSFLLLALFSIITLSQKQAMSAYNTTKSELYAATSAGKIAKWLRVWMSDIDLPYTAPIPMGEDNEAATRIIGHAGKLTGNVHHLAIQTNELQSFLGMGHMALHCVGSTNNKADQATKMWFLIVLFIPILLL